LKRLQQKHTLCAQESPDDEHALMDPLAFIFLTGAIASVVALASPVFIVQHMLWRRRARLLNADARCGRCRRALPISELYLYSGRYVCGSCGAALRTRMRRWLPVALGTAVVCGISAFSALAVSFATQGPQLQWWLSGRLIPLLLPSVGFATATITAVRVGQWANALSNRRARAELDAGDEVSAGLVRGA
jgi:hypothetical protein